MSNKFVPENETAKSVNHTWPKAPGGPPIHHHDEGGVNSRNPAGGYIGRRESPMDRSNRGESSAPKA
jgi:hypothetical protein